MPRITINFDTDIDFLKIKDAATPHHLAICCRILPNGKKDGGEYVALNPLRNDNQLGSFRINLETGRWADFACSEDENAKGGDIISLISYLYEINQFEAAHVIARMIGVK